MVSALRALVVIGATASAAAMATATPAQASEESFLWPLQAKYVFLSSQQLLAAGHKVCDAERRGMTSADAANMLQKDLGLSLPASVDIVGAAVVNLGC